MRTINKKLNVLILGGNGYLGSKVIRRLLIEDHRVVCTKRSTSNLERLEDIKDQIKWIPASVDAVETAAGFEPFDYMINMACNYGRGTFLYDNVLEANIVFPLKTVNKMVEMGTKNYITIGTGLPDDFSMYSFAKKMFSEFGKFYVDKHEINFTNVQLEMIYGPDEPKNRFLPSLIDDMLKGNDVHTTIGIQHRDIIYAEDVIDAIMLIFNASLNGYNDIPVGTGVAPTISEIVDYIWYETGRKSKVYKGDVPMRIGEPDCKADVSIIKSLGSWKPVEWKKGLTKMIAEMKKTDRNDNQERCV